jgi:hypothetical protein
MSRQPIAGVGAADRSPSGEAARTPASSHSPSSPLPPQRYRALRARYNALLVTLYERSSLTLRDIGAIAGRTERAVQMLARALGCRYRYAKKGRRGATIGARRPGASPPPLNAPATRRVVAAFAGVARELAAYTETRAASDLQCATARATRRINRTQRRVMASAMRELGHLAVVIENAAAAREALAAGRGREAKAFRAGQSAGARKPRSREEMWDAQQRLLREQEARMTQAHAAARRAQARRPEAAPVVSPPRDADADRRIDEIAQRYCAGPPREPRIRGL